MFSSTEEALSFGLQAGQEERLMLARLRKMFLRDFDLAMNRGALDRASVLATQAQFCREALEVKTIKEQNPELF